MQTKFGPEFNKDKLKNKLKSCKKWYSAMKAMLNLSGFGWDEERKKDTAEAGVWDDYIARHSAAPGGSSRQTVRRQSARDAMVVVTQSMAYAIHTMARNTSEERMKKVWEAVLPLDLEPVMKFRAFQQLENEENASQSLALDSEYRKLFILNFLNN
ncbi:L10-interacting MYB domain-containing protein [Cinnamomum micranthum f. kanehirae]|uniref:L10-interacting MYB domain-containing protein n=1 Tax=Cinnamomum micranthum f. kanehirae TaxID=337451 RepID=A0A443NCQ0_9MAGN|nr:L10-interacting MYB domain-containing protein [Cinnamomum micranthum f. kanehirae]